MNIIDTVFIRCGTNEVFPAGSFAFVAGFVPLELIGMEIQSSLALFFRLLHTTISHAYRSERARRRAQLLGLSS
jgi:hypothetical protein